MSYSKFSVYTSQLVMMLYVGKAVNEDEEVPVVLNSW